MTKNIGRYELGEELGQGGFGRVYRAHDPAVKRMVAIKTMTAAEDADSLRRFRNEAASAGRLHHPNIVIVYDFGEHEGSPYLVMELLDGEDLGKIMEMGRPMTMLKAVDIMIQVAAGLNHAHTRGVIHRDVKPANIMILPDGTAKVLDFGIALATQLTTESRITRDGSMLGTLKYMAPEQFDGAAPGVPSDIFAYGVTFYKLLSGKHPFEAQQVAEVMRNIVSVEPPPLRSVNPECPEALSAVIGKMLAKNPAVRYQTLDDVRLELGPILGQLKRQASTPFLLDGRLALEAGDIESAQRNLKSALEIEPESEEAQTLQQRIRRASRERDIARQLSELRAGAEQDLAAHQYEAAIRKIESALQLSPQDRQLEQQLDHAKQALAKRRYADDMTSKAGEATRIGRWDLAALQLREAITADPSHADAQTLLWKVEAQIAEQQRQQQLAQERELQRQIQELSARAEEDLAARRLESALGKIESGLKLNPNDRHLQEQWDRAQKMLRDRQFCDALMREATRAHESGDLSLASQKLKAVIATDPGHSAAATLLGEVTRQVAERERQQKENELRQERLETIAAEERRKQQAAAAAAQAVDTAPAESPVATEGIPRGNRSKARRTMLVSAAATFVLLSAIGASVWLIPATKKAGGTRKTSSLDQEAKRIEQVQPPSQVGSVPELLAGTATATAQNPHSAEQATHSLDESAKRIAPSHAEKKSAVTPVATVNPKPTVMPPPPPATVEVAPNSAATALNAEQEEVRKALRGFSAAIRQKDVSLLKQAWPTIPKSELERWSQKFQSAESLSFDLAPRTPAIQGSVARVECDGTTRELYPGASDSYASRRVVQVSLQKVDGQWKISTLR